MDTDLERIYAALGSRYWGWSFAPGQTPPPTLLTLLQKELPHIEAASWQTRLALGGAYVNGRRVSRDVSLSAPCKVEYYEPKRDLECYCRGQPSFDAQRHIIFEDEYLLAVFKPAGLSCLPTRDQQSHNLCAYLEHYLRAKIHMPSRLDHSCSGLVLTSKSPAAHALLQRAYEQRRVEKFYLLECAGVCSWDSKRMQIGIVRDPRHPVLRKTSHEAAKTAITEFQVVGRMPHGHVPLVLLEARPHTGRTHQIRVHIAALGLPIVGDNFYGGLRAPELRLLSCRLRLKHPLTGQDLDLRLPPALEPAWLHRWGNIGL